MPNMLIVTASGWYGMMIDFSHSPSQISFNWMSNTPLITHMHTHTPPCTLVQEKIYCRNEMPVNV